MTKGKIGIFDSGVGGLTVAREVIKLLPLESIVYLGDTARVPYGTKSSLTVTKFSAQALNFLQTRGVKLIVIACNTVSALSLSSLKKNFSLPIVGVLKPGAEKAVNTTRRGVIGVIGTEATIRSRAYPKIIKSINPKIKVRGRSCPLLVPLVEEGWLKEKVTYNVVSFYLRPLLKKRIDTLILGCTHYPLLKSVIQEIVGEKIVLIDSAREVAKQVRKILKEKNMLRDFKDWSGKNVSQHQFFVTDRPEKFSSLTKVFLGKNINGNAQKISLE